MTIRNARVSDFDPDLLKPAGPSSTQAFGVQSGDSGEQTTITQTPMVGPDGRTYVMQMRSDSESPTFISKGEDGKTTAFQPFGDKGQWMEGEFHKRGLIEATLGDKRFMSFLAVASLGAGAAAYAGAGAAGGAGTASMSAGELAAMDAAGGAAAGTGEIAATGVLSSAAPSVAGAGGAAGAASTAATVSNGLAPATTWYGQLFNTAMANPQVTAGIISGVGQGIAGYQKQGNDEELLDKKLAHESAESDKAIAAKSRNFQGSSYAKINWGERPNLTTELPTMRNSGPTAAQLPIGVRLSKLGVLERERNG